MKHYTQAHSPSNDSIEFMLLNLVDFYVNETSRKSRLCYWRGADYTEREVPAELFNQTCLGLFEQLVMLEHAPHLKPFENIYVIQATAAYLFDAYYRLDEAGLYQTNYPHMTGIRSVSASMEPGCFALDCVSFKAQKNDALRFPAIAVNPIRQLVVPANVLESLWEGSTRHLPILESLGYSANDIVETLIAGIHPGGTESNKLSIEFE